MPLQTSKKTQREESNTHNKQTTTQRKQRSKGRGVGVSFEDLAKQNPNRDCCPQSERRSFTSPTCLGVSLTPTQLHHSTFHLLSPKPTQRTTRSSSSQQLGPKPSSMDKRTFTLLPVAGGDAQDPTVGHPPSFLSCSSCPFLSSLSKKKNEKKKEKQSRGR